MNDDSASLTAVALPFECGGAVPGLGMAAYRLRRLEEPSIPVLVAVPHSGRCYPAEVLSDLRDPLQTSVRLEDRFVDSLAELVAASTGSSMLVADAPRAMIDLNRSLEDVDWDMIAGPRHQPPRKSLINRRARHGLGLVPRRIPGFGELWRKPIARQTLDQRIEAIYHPYHNALAAELERLRDRWGSALLIDLHSMPPLRPTHPQDKPAEFVIGDRFGASCAPEVSELAMRFLADHGRRVVHNRPYSGGYVLDRYGQVARGIHAVQIEVCRSTYLDARLDQPSARVGAIGKLIAGLVRALAAEVMDIGRNRRLPQAAE
jgi:N-formylglutamate amidohydrolase